MLLIVINLFNWLLKYRETFVQYKTTTRLLALIGSLVDVTGSYLFNIVWIIMIY